MSATASTAGERLADMLLANGNTAKPSGSNTWQAQCPAHPDRNPSLTITQIEGQALVYCHAGCHIDAVLAALKLGKSDLFDNPKGAAYEYRGADGQLARTVFRTPAKRFRQTVIDNDTVPLYKLQKVIAAVKAGAPLYICEGEKDAHALESQGVTATTAPAGAGNWAKADHEPLRGAANVHICIDLDEAGKKRGAALYKHLTEITPGPVRILAAAEGKDVADHIAAGHTIADLVEISPTELEGVGPAAEEAPHSYLRTAISAADLMATDFPPIRYVVEDLIPEGLTMVVAPPKIGKSWLVLGIGLAVSNGTAALGCIPTQQRPVLYLALEDGHRRLKSRLVSLGAVKPSPDLTFITSVTSGFIPDTIGEYFEKHSGKAPVVFLDTLGKAMPSAGAGETTYERDYRVVGGLKMLADAHPGSSIIIVHHTRKASGSDFVDAVSGTQGIAGAADTILLLQRDRGEKNATLHATSRDTREGEYAIDLDDSGRWTLTGGSLEAAACAEQTAKVTGGLSDRMTDVITTVGRHPEGITPRSLKALLRDIPPEAVDVYLGRAHLAGRLRKLERGKYAPLPQPALNLSPA